MKLPVRHHTGFRRLDNFLDAVACGVVVLGALTLTALAVIAFLHLHGGM